MPRARAKGKVDPKLTKAVAHLLKEVTAASSKCSLTDKLKVIDRALKLEAIRAKLDDSGYGSGFGKTPEPDEPDDDEDE